MSVAVIIPAYNEEIGIAGVLEVVTSARLPDEIIVVSDGSTDKTVEIAESFEGVKVFQQNPNQGKAAAMQRGVAETSADVIVFLDADLVGLKPEFIDALIKPILSDSTDITMGLFSEGKFSTDWIQKVFPFLTGQRGMKRSIWEGAKIDENLGYGVEMMLTKYIAAHNLRVENVLLKGCSQFFKEEKTKGKAVDGFGRRMKMAWEVIKLMLTPSPPEYREAKKNNKKKKN
ncbi:MAG: glycosyltransferase family 2 protein [Caldisericia bacterium]|nr:glycosyltransferase family 2 protein [Caldisericia bacterium]